MVVIGPRVIRPLPETHDWLPMAAHRTARVSVLIPLVISNFDTKYSQASSVLL